MRLRAWALGAGVLLSQNGFAQGFAEPPLPPPRPVDLPIPEIQGPPMPAADVAVPIPPSRPPDLVLPVPEAAPPALRVASEKDIGACRALLESGTVVAHSIPPIRGSGECGIDAPVSLEAIVAGEKRIRLDPAPSVRCDLAAALARWIAEDVAPALEANGLSLERVANADAYSCRSRNHVGGAKLSEHGKGNAIDLAALVVARDRRIPLTSREAAPFAMLLRTSACARFATVLGPGSDGYHEDHIHLDLEDRRTHGTLCQWNITPAGPEGLKP